MVEQDLFLTTEEGLVLSKILHHKGKQNSVSRMELSLLTGLDDRTIRQAIKDLIEEHGQPIGSNYAGGYYMIADREELKKTYETLRGHALSILKRAAKLRKISLPELLGQLTLEEVSEHGTNH